MKSNLLIFSMICCLSSCGHLENNTLDKKREDSSRIDSTNIQAKNLVNRNNFDTIPDFLKLSEDPKVEGYNGYLAGISKSDSSGPYVIREYITDTLSFHLIFASKASNKAIVTFDSIRNDAVNDYANYSCIAFVYPMRDPNKMKNYHDDNVKYPVTVKSYFRKNGSWILLSHSVVKNLMELSEYEIKSIYSVSN